MQVTALLKRIVAFWHTNLGYCPLQVVLAHIRGLLTDSLLCSLHAVAQVTAATLKLFQ